VCFGVNSPTGCNSDPNKLSVVQRRPVFTKNGCSLVNDALFLPKSAQSESLDKQTDLSFPIRSPTGCISDPNQLTVVQRSPAFTKRDREVFKNGQTCQGNSFLACITTFLINRILQGLPRG